MPAVYNATHVLFCFQLLSFSLQEANDGERWQPSQSILLFLPKASPHLFWWSHIQVKFPLELSPLILFETTFLQRFSKILIPDYGMSTPENGWFIFWFHTIIWWMITILIGDIYEDIYILDFLFIFPVLGVDPQVVFFVFSQHHGDTTKN